MIHYQKVINGLDGLKLASQLAPPVEEKNQVQLKQKHFCGLSLLDPKTCIKAYIANAVNVPTEKPPLNSSTKGIQSLCSGILFSDITRPHKIKLNKISVVGFKQNRCFPSQSWGLRHSCSPSKLMMLHTCPTPADLDKNTLPHQWSTVILKTSNHYPQFKDLKYMPV